MELLIILGFGTLIIITYFIFISVTDLEEKLDKQQKEIEDLNYYARLLFDTLAMSTHGKIMSQVCEIRNKERDSIKEDSSKHTIVKEDENNVIGD